MIIKINTNGRTLDLGVKRPGPYGSGMMWQWYYTFGGDGSNPDDWLSYSEYDAAFKIWGRAGGINLPPDLPHSIYPSDEATDIPIDSDISINVQKLNYKKIQKLLTTNGYLDRLSKKIDLNNRLEQYSKLTINLFQPTISPIIDFKTKKSIKVVCVFGASEDNIS